MHGREARLPIQLTLTSDLDEDDFEGKVKHMAELRPKVHSNPTLKKPRSVKRNITMQNTTQTQD